MNTELKKHWDTAYLKTETQNLGWYEETPEQTWELIQKTNLPKNARILIAGAGSSTLIDFLLDKGYTNIIANDLSSEALNQLKERIGETNHVSFIVDDLTNPEKLNTIEPIDLWIDRAVLHFFNEKKDQDTYWNLVQNLLKLDGYALIAAFNLNGAEKCCGLPVHRYSKELIAEGIGSDYDLEEAFDYTFINPKGGERPYIYTLFKKK